jgi:hypothetical protein
MGWGPYTALVGGFLPFTWVVSGLRVLGSGDGRIANGSESGLRITSPARPLSPFLVSGGSETGLRACVPCFPGDRQRSE